MRSPPDPKVPSLFPGMNGLGRGEKVCYNFPLEKYRAILAGDLTMPRKRPLTVASKKARLAKKVARRNGNKPKLGIPQLKKPNAL